MIYMFLSNNSSSGGYKFVEFALFKLTTIVKEYAQPGNRTCKTPNNRFDMLQTAITLMANINGYHQLSLSTSE